MRYVNLLAALTFTLITLLPMHPAWAFDTIAKSAYVYDFNTKTVLMDKKADVAFPPASMSKLMTLNMLFEALRDGRVSLETRFTVSARAKAMGGSTMFLNENDRPTVEELIKGIIVLSGNDACVAVAENLAGTEEAFANSMTQRARALGMNSSVFANASGWPHPNHRMSMRDLGVLAERLISEFPEYYGYFGMAEFPWDGRAPQNRFNRNPLLKLSIGADGLKTGHTQEAGYGLVGSAIQNGRRVIFVLGGLETEKDRATESERVVNWAFRQFVERKIVEKNTRVADVPVWLGEFESVSLLTANDITMLIPALVQDDIPAEITYRTPLEAPLEAGQIVGEMVIRVPEMPEQRVNLLVDRSVPKGGFLPRVRTAARILFDKVAGKAESAL